VRFAEAVPGGIDLELISEAARLEGLAVLPDPR
jgi:hypothetical protein